MYMCVMSTRVLHHFFVFVRQLLVLDFVARALVWFDFSKFKIGPPPYTAGIEACSV